MKTLLSIFTFLLVAIPVSAQQFDKTDAYNIEIQQIPGEDDTVFASANLYTDDEIPVEITTIPIADFEMINRINITQLKNPGLNGVKKVLKVEVQYIEYCSYYVANYILETEKGGYINLPILTNEDCGDTTTEMVYLFPSQKFGKENEILTSQVIYNSKIVVDAEMENSFIWNDDNYGTSGNLYEEL